MSLKTGALPSHGALTNPGFKLGSRNQVRNLQTFLLFPLDHQAVMDTDADSVNMRDCFNAFRLVLNLFVVGRQAGGFGNFFFKLLDLSIFRFIL